MYVYIYGIPCQYTSSPINDLVHTIPKNHGQNNVKKRQQI